MADYDVIVVGARLAGAATAFLLAREGLRVLALERSRFPSDTLSSHQLQLPGVDLLARWNLLDRLLATGVPPTRHVRFDAGSGVLRGSMSDDGVAHAMYSPRRLVLDALLVQAAREAGAEVIEGFDVNHVLGDGHTVTGVQGRSRDTAGGPTRSFSAPLVIGADGKNSTLATLVKAPTIRSDPRASAAAYAYWQGLHLEAGEIYSRPRRMIGAWPTHDGLTVTYVGMPAVEFAAFRADPGAALIRTLDLAGDLGERARAATRVSPVRGTTDLPNVVRRSAGPGWALAGDAGLVMDPGTGQGMGHALQDADALARAVVAGLGGGQGSVSAALERYQRERDQRRLPMYRFTVDLATYEPPAGSEALFEAIAGSPEQTEAFFEVLAGIRSPNDVFGVRNLLRLLGFRGLLRTARGRRRAAPTPAVSG